MQEVEKLGERARDPALSAALACIKAYDLIIAGKNDAAKPYVGEGLRSDEDGYAIAFRRRVRVLSSRCDARECHRRVPPAALFKR